MFAAGFVACGVDGNRKLRQQSIQQARSTHYYRSVKDPQTALRQRMREIAQTRVRYGYRQVHVLLKRGSRPRALTVVDVFSREALAIEVGKRWRAENVVSVLNRLVAQRRAPRFLFARQRRRVLGAFAGYAGVPRQGTDRLQPSGQAHG